MRDDGSEMMNFLQFRGFLLWWVPSWTVEDAHSFVVANPKQRYNIIVSRYKERIDLKDIMASHCVRATDQCFRSPRRSQLPWSSSRKANST